MSCIVRNFVKSDMEILRPFPWFIALITSENFVQFDRVDDITCVGSSPTSVSENYRPFSNCITVFVLLNTLKLK